MDNFFELEKKCKKYHRKKWISIFILLLFILIVVVIYFILSNKQTDTTKIVLKKQNFSQQIPILKVELNLNEIKTIKEDNSTATKLPKKIKQPIKIEAKTKEVKPKKLIITTEAPSFEKSFELMNLYFNNKNYIKAKEWAIKASKVKSYNEDVWNIYALSLYYLNEKEKAIEVLETYLKYKKSKKLENTLKIIKQGEEK